VEGCLSIPGYRGLVKRSVSVRARAIGLDGKVIRIKADGLLAQALEHETGHLQGSLYIDHLVTPVDLWKIPQDGEEEEEEEESGEDSGSGQGTAAEDQQTGEQPE
jgi:peptide deformylase